MQKLGLSDNCVLVVAFTRQFVLVLSLVHSLEDPEGHTGTWGDGQWAMWFPFKFHIGPDSYSTWWAQDPSAMGHPQAPALPGRHPALS